MTSSHRCYLDHNASVPIRPAALEAMARAASAIGNPSSVHHEGRHVRALVEEAREHVADLAGAQARHVIFTSGATESANLALSPSLRPSVRGVTRDQLFVAATEHLCVLQGHRFPQAVFLKIHENGLLDQDYLKQSLEQFDHPLVAIQLANNETGVIQPLQEIAAMIHARDGMVFCDAVQGFGRIPVSIKKLGADMISLSAHKMGGASGIGALVFASSDIMIDDKLIRGGGQEQGWRAGTPNVPGIVAFGAVAREVMQERDRAAQIYADLQDAFETRLLNMAPDAIIFGRHAPRLPNTTCFAIPGLTAELALIRLDLEGIALSSGSACSSGKVKTSHVLQAMGISDDLSRCALRISFGRGNTMQDVERLLMVLTKEMP
jgi:cysteine desulfurase